MNAGKQIDLMQGAYDISKGTSRALDSSLTPEQRIEGLEQLYSGLYTTASAVFGELHPALKTPALLAQFDLMVSAANKLSEVGVGTSREQLQAMADYAAAYSGFAANFVGPQGGLALRALSLGLTAIAEALAKGEITEAEAAERMRKQIDSIMGGVKKGSVLGRQRSYVSGLMIDPRVGDQFDRAPDANAPPRRDPLILDLDGDGIESVGVNNETPLMFDHDGDGIKESSGWIQGDDGFLVLDRNGNGTIDSGGELFGDATYLANGQKAVDGFAALADLDTNQDGQVNANDAAFADLRVWSDLNQDGISQSNELLTLGSLNIVGLNVADTSHSQVLANGNRLADLGTYVKGTGEAGGMGEVGQSADIDLAVDTFTTQFTDTLPISDEAEAQPDMMGSGQVRTLREAATLNPLLLGLLDQFSAATMRAAQVALMDQILDAWADTSLMGTTFEGAYAGHALTVSIEGVNGGSAQYQAWQTKLSILERFNGRTFQPVPAGTDPVTLTLWSPALTLLQQSYDNLKAAVYQSLALQTRLEPLLDLIGLNITETGVELDFTTLNAEFDARIAADTNVGLADLIDFSFATRDMLSDTGWGGVPAAIARANEVGMSPAIRSILASFGAQVEGLPSWNNFGTATGDIMIGGTGNDSLWGQEGDDILDGGAGDDTLRGGEGEDTYLFYRGMGKDWVYATSSTSQADDIIHMAADILPEHIQLRKYGNNVDVTLVDANGNYLEAMVLADYFPYTSGPIKGIQFADGTFWDDAYIRNHVYVLGGAGNDSLSAVADSSSTMEGFAGNDSLTGSGGNDTLRGGAGDDTLRGQAGDDILDGGSGTDQLYGGEGEDTYLFYRGIGKDWIRSTSATSQGEDIIQMASDILPSQIQLRRYGNNIDVNLLNTSGVATDVMVLDGHFLSAANQIKGIQFADGTFWSSALISSAAQTYGSSASETITGWTTHDNIFGLDGNDTLSGLAGNDALYGGNGNDTLNGGDGNDTLNGGAGSDIFYGGAGSDTYVFDTVDGWEWIYESVTGDKVLLTAFNPQDVQLRRYANNIDVRVKDANGTFTTKAIVLIDALKDANGLNNLASIQFADGTVWNEAKIREMVSVTYGGAGNDNLAGYNGGVNNVYLGTGDDIATGGNLGDSLYGEDGNDTLSGLAGNDALYGGNGNDTLHGGDGDDTLTGGVGSDALNGGLGNDTYLFSLGHGSDTLIENDAMVGNTDVALFGAGIASNQLWFRHVGNHLEVSIIGTSDKVTIQDWYSGESRHIEQFKTADNKLLLDTQVETLVQAMAAFAPPSAGQTTLPQNYQDQLAPVLAANWQ